MPIDMCNVNNHGVYDTKMSEIKFCRICLDKNVRMHQISGSDIQNVYEKLTNKKVQEDTMPYLACYICYSQLRNCQQLIMKSWKSEQLLQQIFSMSCELNVESIALINRVVCGLASSLAVTNVECYQSPENRMVKIENQEETCINEVMIKQEPYDDSAPPIKKLLDENSTIEEDKARCTEGENKSVTGNLSNTVTTGSKSLQIVSDVESKQAPVDNRENTLIRNDCDKTCETKALLVKHISTHRSRDPIIVKKILQKTTMRERT